MEGRLAMLQCGLDKGMGVRTWSARIRTPRPVMECVLQALAKPVQSYMREIMNPITSTRVPV